MYWRQELKKGRKEELRAIFEENRSEDAKVQNLSRPSCCTSTFIPSYLHTITLLFAEATCQSTNVIYHLTCGTCKKTYIGKTDWTLQKHTSEHRSKTKERGIWWKHQCHTGCKGLPFAGNFCNIDFHNH